MGKPEKAEVFISLLSRHERRLSVYVMTLIANQSDAEDILQQAKMVMWRSFDQFREGTNFGAWGRKVALNQIMTFRKRQKRDLLYLSNELLEMIAADLEQNDAPLAKQQKMLEQCIEKLRMLIELFCDYVTTITTRLNQLLTRPNARRVRFTVC